MKACKHCGGTDRYVSGKCKPCTRARRRAAYRADPNKYNEWHRRYRRAHRELYRESRRRSWARDPSRGRNQNLKKYGLTSAAFDELLASQGGLCAICRTSNPGGKGQFHVDHCHESGRVRGLLCHACNLALGQMKDDPSRLREAALYLESVQ